MRRRVERGECSARRSTSPARNWPGGSTAGSSNGRLVTTPEEARRRSGSSRPPGPTSSKLTVSITRPVYDAATETAAEVGIRVVGHVDLQVGLRRALETGQQIEHLDSYMEAVLRDDSPIKVSVSDSGVWRKPNWESLDYVDERKVAEAARATAKAGVYTCPTLTFFKLSFAVEQSDEEIRAAPTTASIPGEIARAAARGAPTFLDGAALGRAARALPAGPESAGQGHSRRRRQAWPVRTRRSSSCSTATRSTRAAEPVEAGLTLRALAAATRTPAEYLRALEDIGNRERASAPTSAPRATRRRDHEHQSASASLARGRWHPRGRFE